MIHGLPHPCSTVSAKAAIVAPRPASAVPVTTKRVARFTSGTWARTANDAIPPPVVRIATRTSIQTRASPAWFLSAQAEGG